MEDHVVSKYSQNMPPDLKAAIGWMYDDIRPGSIFLDFGCATGYFGSLVKAGKQCKVYGVEISDDIREARKVLDGVYSFDLDGEWPAEIYERTYDYLFFGDVLEHLKDPQAALVKARKLLKKGGRILVSVPNIAHMSTRFELLQGSFEYESMGILDNTHLQYFTLQSFIGKAQAAGYSVVRVDCSVNDFPHEVAQKILDNVGLKATPKFWEQMEKIEARAYQYKFVLEPADKPVVKTKLNIAPLPLKPDKFRDAYIKDLHKQVKVLHAHSNDQGKVMEELAAANERLKRENEYFRSNPLVKAGIAVRRKIKKR